MDDSRRPSTLALKDAGGARRFRAISDVVSPVPGRPIPPRPMSVRTPAASIGAKDSFRVKQHYSVFSMTGMEALLSRVTSIGSDEFREESDEKVERAPSLGLTTTTTGMSVLSKPSAMVDSEWEETVKALETEGEWVECRETLSGRILWYNTRTLRMVFDTPPIDTVVPIPATETKGRSHADYLATRPLEPAEGEDLVEGLLSFGMHECDFVNDIVDCYRHVAAQIDHHKMLPKPRQYCFPEYFSESPLPEKPGGIFIAKIRLPEVFAKHRTQSSVKVKMDHTSAMDVIKKSVSRLDKEHHADEKDFILKVVGSDEYMYGRSKIVDYESVRNAVRNEDDVEFVIVKCPEFKERVAEATERQKDYEEEFQTAYPARLRAPGFIPQDEIINKLPQFNVRDTRTFEPQDFLSLYDCDWNYRIKIKGVTNATILSRFDEATMKSIHVRSEVWCGETQLDAATLQTDERTPNSSLAWDSWLISKGCSLSQFPREATVSFIVFAKDLSGTEHCIAWSRMPLIDHRHRLRRGKYLLNMWDIPVFKRHKEGPKTDPYIPMAFRYRGSTRPMQLKQYAAEQCQLLVEFDEFAFEVMAPLQPPAAVTRAVGTKTSRDDMTSKDKDRINSIIAQNPLHKLTFDEKELVWRCREVLWHDPDALSVFLRSVNWSNRSQIVEAHRYLKIWAAPRTPSDALEYLDYKYADHEVRKKAVFWLEDMHDGELQMYLLQLVQALKYENYHDSPLARFLVRRGLRNPYQIGHYLFWHLKAEFHDVQYAERFGLIMEEYLKHAGQHTRQLFVQNNFLKRLEIIAEKIVKARMNMSKDNCKKLLHRELTKLNAVMPETIQMPLNPRWSAKKLIVSKCRFMSSKKVPLWLVFENADPYGQEIVVMFKSGDDLRQDMLTIQVLSVMDSIWLHNGLDLRMSPYKVLATGVNKDKEGVGMMEIVLDSETINTINTMNGGSLRKETINDYLTHHHKSDQELLRARENFARSCAGYCVATFVMGIGDRHSDNIMVKRNGQFFHIDFGHFLGNFKIKKMWGVSIKRERSALVFTPTMKYAIDQSAKSCPLYDQFIEWTGEAYNCLRMRSRLLILLFALMVSAGMPELMSDVDINYLVDMLRLKVDAKKARQHVQSEVKSSLKDWMRILDNRIHEAVHS